MTSLAPRRVPDGKWQFKGKPVTFDFPESRSSTGMVHAKPMGDYVATSLKALALQ